MDKAVLANIEKQFDTLIENKVGILYEQAIELTKEALEKLNGILTIVFESFGEEDSSPDITQLLFSRLSNIQDGRTEVLQCSLKWVDPYILSKIDGRLGNYLSTEGLVDVMASIREIFHWEAVKRLSTYNYWTASRDSIFSMLEDLHQ